MSFDTIWSYAVDFYHDYSIVVLIVAVVLVIAAWQKPKESFKFALFVVVLACALYAIGLFGESIDIGTSNKDRMINKTKGLVD